MDSHATADLQIGAEINAIVRSARMGCDWEDSPGSLTSGGLELVRTLYWLNSRRGFYLERWQRHVMGREGVLEEGWGLASSMRCRQSRMCTNERLEDAVPAEERE